MNRFDSIYSQERWRIIDQTNVDPNFQALQSFAIDDTLCQVVGQRLSPPTFRSWVHKQTIVLGIQDTRLPDVSAGITFLQEHGYDVIVRNSGGLAVVLDEGILNFSIILPEQPGLDIHHSYDAMFKFIQAILSSYSITIEAKEIVGSYCPGSYDLSVNGKKFAGISQRRMQGGIAIQIYLCVTGSGSDRAELIKQFYERAKGKNDHHLMIDPSTMASLSELLGEDMEVRQLLLLGLKALQKSSTLTFSPLSGDELMLYHRYYERITKRNDKALNML